MGSSMISGRRLLYVFHIRIDPCERSLMLLIHFFFSFQLPNQVYRFDPKTSQIRVVADGFDKCNGIAFSPNGTVAYM